MKGGIESQIILPYCPYCPIIVSLPLSLEFFYFLTRDIFFSREGEKRMACVIYYQPLFHEKFVYCDQGTFRATPSDSVVRSS